MLRQQLSPPLLGVLYCCSGEVIAWLQTARGMQAALARPRLHLSVVSSQQQVTGLHCTLQIVSQCKTG